MTITYPALQVGLTNQKIALIGLVFKAQRENTPFSLPDMVSFRPQDGQHEVCDFAQVYQKSVFEALLKAFSIPYTPGPAQADATLVDGWQCFWEGADRWGEAGRAGKASWTNLTAQIIRHLRPVPMLADFADLLRAKLDNNNIRHVLQLRIENDWQGYSRDVLPTFAGQNEEYCPPFLDIVRKAQTTWGADFKKAYVLSDETCLPVPKETIREHTFKELGVELFWKSDFLPQETFKSNLVSSMLDFEIAVHAPFFAGNSRSTFAGFVSFEKFCRTGQMPKHHYIYNIPGQGLGLRHDNGAMMVPEQATDRLYGHEPLIPVHRGDLQWPLSLTAHIACLGDFTSETQMLHGIPSGDLAFDTAGIGGRCVEGFQITSAGLPLPFEYRARDVDGHQTSWMPHDHFCGSKGQSRPLTGFAVRLTGPAFLTTDCFYAGRFEGQRDALTAENGAWCSAGYGQKLVGMHILFRPKGLT
ncbi:O-fucosyltransferase family protein [Acetobacter cibinongensis]|uniref:Uncharacterized protein n=1 Tax=Acetobacter cibinongensis TaxID=146475 RepID=A0A0D6N3L5_9PROT|nr:O-fucosyltransferase family protein [Acetobacter cibinongensis]GAN60544.1 hypothetical protein Abci_012_017 [Acetobacter cibinongensis]GBQ17785.1 hypothetical protein AA0482_2017 [Acetobacter cibinongensis NRIC 0482]GEL59814.1 hypothetical protein ACI01nite_24160 [Acetobacter cibinongensis]